VAGCGVGGADGAGWSDDAGVFAREFDAGGRGVFGVGGVGDADVVGPESEGVRGEAAGAVVLCDEHLELTGGERGAALCLSAGGGSRGESGGGAEGDLFGFEGGVSGFGGGGRSGCLIRLRTYRNRVHE
jgi:hypothetical protein